MQLISQGFYGKVFKDGHYAIKQCVSVSQCQHELASLSKLHGLPNIVRGVAQLNDTTYRYSWCEGDSLKPEQSVIAFQALDRLHQNRQSFYHWAGLVDKYWWRLFARWVNSWFSNLKPSMSEGLYRKMTVLLGDISIILPGLNSSPTLVHGDPHPDNIIYDGVQLWLIDPGISGYAVPELDWAMFARPGFVLPERYHAHQRPIVLMRIFFDLWHWQNTDWRDEAYMLSLLDDYHQGRFAQASFE